MDKKVIVFLVILSISLAVVFYNSTQKKEIHEHADFAVYLDNIKYNFSQEKYMEIISQIHMHDLNGNIIHKHANNVTLGLFFSSLSMSFNSTCFVLDNFTEYCSNPKFYVNGLENKEYDKYQINDLDRILISYNSNATFDMVSNDSCIYSYKCPERGSPPEESNCTVETGCTE